MCGGDSPSQTLDIENQEDQPYTVETQLTITAYTLSGGPLLGVEGAGQKLAKTDAGQAKPQPAAAAAAAAKAAAH